MENTLHLLGVDPIVPAVLLFLIRWFKYHITVCHIWRHWMKYYNHVLVLNYVIAWMISNILSYTNEFGYGTDKSNSTLCENLIGQSNAPTYILFEQ